LEKKYQIFISSTFTDLEKERDSIIKAILELYHIPIGMEMFSAEDEDQWEIIRRTIDVSDYYVLVLGLRYGSKGEDGISFTQKEYEYALSKKIPILSFVMDDEAPLSKDKRDNDLTDINNFRSKVLSNTKMAKFWSTKDQLVNHVTLALSKQIMQKPGVGWVRGDSVAMEDSLKDEVAALSKENRGLREQIINLETRLSPKIPNIDLFINPQNKQANKDFKISTIPDQLIPSEIPTHLSRYIRSSEIEYFNKNLPTQEVIDDFNSKYKVAFLINECSNPLIIEIKNNGSTKANNIYVDITFPEGIHITDISDEDYPYPKSPLPESPLIKAQKQYEYYRSGGGIIGGAAEHLFPKIHNLPSLASTLNRNEWTKLKDNKLTIHINNLIHTRKAEFSDEYKITFLESGKHIIKYSIICEEFQSSVEKEIEIEA